MSFHILIAITIIMWGIAPIFSKIANSNMDPVMVSSVQTIFYLLLMPLSIWFFKPNFHITFTGVAAAWTAGLITALGSLAFFFALKRTETGIVTAFLLLIQ